MNPSPIREFVELLLGILTALLIVVLAIAVIGLITYLAVGTIGGWLWLTLWLLS